ncbi:family 16 glycosylhydrolase [Belnapia sp. T18]|uniref:Family 16 glycosylhydrolase n=1 Tax=Belnapia arida TaxID=2804533 RepID=A0ABS1UBX9_9PROT|nr:Calx-beta domain-containing protein [Belnapia arida]MBL6082193.1 family 16 glycosylhydrolase [Belnapia arida]
MPPANMPLEAHVPALKPGNPGKGLIKKATDADVKLTALSVESLDGQSPLDPSKFKQVWSESFDWGVGRLQTVYGDVKITGGMAVLSGTDVTPTVTNVKGPDDWKPAGVMVPATGASMGDGYGLYSITLKTDPREGPGPFATLWPASNKWPGPELDIFEKASQDDYDGYSTIHYKTSTNGDGYDVYRYPTGKFNASQEHTYSLEWAQEHITLYIDNEWVFTTTKNVPKDYIHGGENAAFGVGMQPAWAWQQQNGFTNVLYVYDMSYAAPPPSEMTVSDARITESGDLAFVVELDKIPASAVTVSYSLTNGTADGSDYTVEGNTLTFGPNETTKTIIVHTTDDTTFEPDETLTLTLSSPNQYATLVKATATGTIVNDDAAPVVVPGMSVSDFTAAEGSKLLFTVSMDKPTTATVTVNYSTVTGTASASDFTGVSNSLTFAPGETSKMVEVLTATDSLAESNETMTLNLSNPIGATLVDGSGTGTITNVAPVSLPGLRVSDVSVNEGGILNFTVSLSKAATTSATVKYATADSTALSRSDYTAVANTLTFSAGQTSKMVSVQTTHDTAYEANETVFLRLSEPSGATLVDAEGRGTILNNDVVGRTVAGTTSNNTLSGAGGDDTVTGGRGNDTMTGGAGADDFVFSRLDGYDRIKDFVPGTDDLVFRSIASSTVVAKSAIAFGVSGIDVAYGTNGDHVFLDGITLSQFSLSRDAIFA